MKNLINRLRKLEFQKGSVFILYSYPFNATEEQIKVAQTQATEKYIAEGGDPDLPKTFVSIVEFSDAPPSSKWIYA